MLYYHGYPNADGSSVSLTAWGGQENNELDTTDFNQQGTFDLWGREHEAILGYTHAKSEQFDRQQSGSIDDSNINNATTVYDGVTYITQYTTDWANWTPTDVTWLAYSDAADYTQTNRSIYAATRLHLTDAVRVILGGNYVKADSESVSYSSPMNYSESKFSPYAGITYNFTPKYTGYMSYTSIFRPQPSVDESTGQVADPIDGKSFDITPNLTTQANGDNITDEKYLNSFNDGQAFYGEPAKHTVALKFKRQFM